MTTAGPGEDARGIRPTRPELDEAFNARWTSTRNAARPADEWRNWTWNWLTRTWDKHGARRCALTR